MDGTLLDSRKYHWLAWRATMAGEGVELSEAEFAATFGWRNDTILRRWFGAGIAAGEIVRIADNKEAHYRELLRTHGAQLLPGVDHWLKTLHATGWRQALATSAPPANVDAILGALHVGPFFDAIVHADHVTAGKPDPQVFLLAAERLSIAPPRCIVVEDAPAGVEGARRAGMKCIGVGPAHAALPADLTVPALDQLAEGAFAALLDTE
jgi:HAD superfamily hydrolase (TIGR01509 family)